MPGGRRGRGEFSGLKGVARSIGETNALITVSDDLRNDIVHMNRMRGGVGELRSRASELARRLEPLLLTSVLRVLGVAPSTDLPLGATSPEPFSVVLDAWITQADPSVWANGVHPGLEINWGQVDYLPARGESVALRGDLIVANSNIDRVEGLQLRVFDPSLPAMPHVTIEEKKE
jgi:hypothetical protein